MWERPAGRSRRLIPRPPSLYKKPLQDADGRRIIARDWRCLLRTDRRAFLKDVAGAAGVVFVGCRPTDGAGHRRSRAAAARGAGALQGEQRKNVAMAAPWRRAAADE